MKYRKKPVIVDAIRVKDALQLAAHKWSSLPEWLKVKYEYELGLIILMPKYCVINTLEGAMEASSEDWIIQGIKGEIYPCRPDIFEVTYEKVEEPIIMIGSEE